MQWHERKINALNSLNALSRHAKFNTTIELFHIHCRRFWDTSGLWCIIKDIFLFILSQIVQLLLGIALDQ